jgi:hypothetical protein
MQPSRLIAVAASIFLFALTGIVTHFAMDRSDYSFCEKRLDITLVALIALVLLVVSLRIRGHEESRARRRLVRATAYMLVLAVSAGFWFDVFATQECRESPRKRLEKLRLSVK